MNANYKTVVGVDTAKSVFQVYTVEQATGEVINKPIKRAQFLCSGQVISDTTISSFSAIMRS
jgi:hypothetical protein